MSNERRYPRRLIEVDLPIKEISAHARSERSTGPISTLHLWWARRPLAACRSVALASLLPDPCDPACGDGFRQVARETLSQFGLGRSSGAKANEALRDGLLKFVALLADRQAASNAILLRAARELIASASASMGAGERPVLADPFAGGGAIPVEGLRLGVTTIASDLNPIPVMLNRLLVEAVPKLGAEQLADLISAAGRTVEDRARQRLQTAYPRDADKRIPIAFIWARTVRCEGPGCGATLPLVRSLSLDKKSTTKTVLSIRLDGGALTFDLTNGRNARPGEGIMKGGSATCPACGYTTKNSAVRTQLSAMRGGVRSARLVAVVTVDSSGRGREFRLPNASDAEALASADALLASVPQDAIPHEAVSDKRPSPNARGLSGITRIGVSSFADLFTPRQLAALVVFLEEASKAGDEVEHEHGRAVADAVTLGLACALGRCADHWNSCCTWNPSGLKLQAMFKRQAIPVVWDFCEANPFGGSVGSWESAVGCVVGAIHNAGQPAAEGVVLLADAANHPYPDDSVDLLFTDPPYYDSVPYADLSDFFYVWHRRLLGRRIPDLFAVGLTPKDEEAIWNPSRVHGPSGEAKSKEFYERKMRDSLAEARRLTKPGGLGVVVFAHKSTAGWEAILSALVEAGWVATASWPLDTELGTRVNAMGTASLASSVHIVCRPRENPDGPVESDSVGDWRAVLRELPKRIHEWMPRLAKEGVVGADAIFACIGPALEIFSRYSRVEKASGERVALREYLEQVWAAVAREALSMIFEDADATGMEEDARLTAMWLWTLSTNANGGGNGGSRSTGEDEANPEGEDDEEEGTSRAKPSAGFSLEFDAARKIAQGLGAHLEDLGRVIEIKGDKARLLSVAERTRHLFGKDQPKQQPARRAKKVKQLTLFDELEAAEKDAEWGDVGLPPLGETTLDRVHQAMVLFAAARGEALKRFLVEEGVGRAATFWKLAQSLSALYPNGTDEKRWVDGVLARKKGLGFG